MDISFFEFMRLGSDQRAGSLPAALFLRLVGPLGTHARIRNARVIRTLPAIDLSGKRVLDLGCGHGYTLFWLARRFPRGQFEGIDVDTQRMADGNRAAQRAGLSNLCFRPGVFSDLADQPQADVLISIDVLEHVEDDLGMLRKMVTILRPGGCMVIHVPLRHQVQRRILPVFRHHTVEDHVRDEYLPEEISEKIEAAGGCILSTGYGFGFWGELSFELNNLFWQRRGLRNLSALCTLPLCLAAGYHDAANARVIGNSIVLLVQRADDVLCG